MSNPRMSALLAAAAGLSVGLPTFEVRRQQNADSPFWPPVREPDNRGRRAEKDAAKLAKAEEKRKRRAAKRLTPNLNSTTPNVSQSGDDVA